ncbi:hypothetical protein BB558_001520 [Smittium angustum]|nr:hypothetical protein BB558_002018 [Smittium angustum]PWA02339.1 hypothetical protein BB558_001520 [Smittium angustum]
MFTLAFDQNFPNILVSGTQTCLIALNGRKIQDPDLVSDINDFSKALGEKLDCISTWDEYVNEVKSGMLSWTPVHTSDQFWKVNYMRLNENNYMVVHLLSNLMKTSGDSTVIAVACHDLGLYIKHYPDGKSILNNLGTKHKAMELMTHSDSDVRYEALTTVQTFMMNAWKNTQINAA